MKIKKERKTKVKKSVQKKERQIGRIFNPIVRGLRLVVVFLSAYYILFGSSVYVIPGLCDMIYSMNNMAAVDNIAALLAVWAFPCLFVIAFLFLGDVIIIRFIIKKSRAFADKLIADFKERQEKIAQEMSEKAESKVV